MQSWVISLEDEIFYSIVLGDYLISGMSENRYLKEKLNVNYLGVYSLKFLENYSVKYIMDNHSILPAITPFIYKQESIKLEEEIKSRGKYRYLYTFNGYKICPECFKNDVRKYGQGYLRRVHQMEVRLAWNILWT